MSIPARVNATCDIYRAGTSPPAAPAVAHVPCHLQAAYALGLEAGEGDDASLKFTHTMLVDFRTDVRDSYSTGIVGAGADSVYVPDQSGTPFRVIFVEHHLTDRLHSYKKVFLARRAVAWPTTEL